MLSFPDWSEEADEDVGDHSLRVLTVEDMNLETARDLVAAVVPEHYTSPQHVARVFDNLGKPAVAKLLRTKLPTGKTSRSGDVGEIIATEYVDECTEFSTPIKRLRWKDHREMPMRGDDVIGICLPHNRRRIRFLKVEAKSKAALKTQTVARAREALDGDDGRPSSHALTFMSERLIEMRQEELADAIDFAQLRDGIAVKQVSHMLFVFTGNAPNGFLQTDLENYGGPIAQRSVGLRITRHQEFIASVYDKVIADNES
jgi:HamA